MHSYGGQAGTNAPVRAWTGSSDKVGSTRWHLTPDLHDCIRSPRRQCNDNKVKEFGNIDRVPIVFDFADDDTCSFRSPKGLMVGPGLDEAEADKFVGTFVCWSGKGMYKATGNAAWHKIPASYIYTTTDVTVPMAYHIVEELEKAQALGTNL
ncbi:hypothetical protein F4678DRAFT_424668 [Xylaria arbuscula]|nr:hypothetical protein F4678DRAFT_424668 [Xylaria arbuscula]